MNKIPTIFVRDWEGDRSRVLDMPNSQCQWVFRGEGVATRKYDGACCAVLEDGTFVRRHEVKLKRVRAKRARRPEVGEPMVLADTPEGFVEVERNQHPEHPGMFELVGWVPVSDTDPSDKWFVEAYANYSDFGFGIPQPGTYELLGPKINKNPEGFLHHIIVPHRSAAAYIVMPRTYDRIYEMLKNLPIEGFVFHHPDGRMAKIKARDFGINRQPYDGGAGNVKAKVAVEL